MSQEPASKPRIRTDILLEIITAAAFAVVACVVLASSYGTSISSAVRGYTLAIRLMRTVPN
jgi:hypothetical protein